MGTLRNIKIFFVNFIKGYAAANRSNKKNIYFSGGLIKNSAESKKDLEYDKIDIGCR